MSPLHGAHVTFQSAGINAIGRLLHMYSVKSIILMTEVRILRTLSKLGFSLIELLVVVAIIAILASLVLVCISSIREQARRTKCLSNQRNLGMGVMCIATDNEGVLPSTTVDIAFPRANPGWFWLENGPVGYEDNLTVLRLSQYLTNGERIYSEMKSQLAGAAVNADWKGVNVRTEW